MNKKELMVGNLTDKGIIKDLLENDIHVGGGKTFSYGDVNPVVVTDDFIRDDLDDWVFDGFGNRLIYKHVKFKVLRLEFTEYIYNNPIVFHFHDKVLNYKKYVHEVQNLFFLLTGEELKLKTK